MNVLENTSLLAYNTFGIDAQARYFSSVQSLDDLQEVLQNSTYGAAPLLVLGGGSNVLFTQDFGGLVLQIDLKGITVTELDDHYRVTAGAGENWHQFVLHCIQANYAGIENLSLIPGNIGAAPMQNIGAYGVELKDVFHELSAYHIPTGEVHTFSAEECGFGYRTSVFKTSVKGQYIITSVTLNLQKTPSFNTSYGAIERELESMQVEDLSIQAVSQAVINIRQSKLPDPKEIGNAGSFFKNPVIETAQYESLKKQFPDIVGYPAGSQTKVAAGWLIDQAGWKGHTNNNYGVHKRQALVLVNYGGAPGKAIYDLSSEIQQSIQERYGITLEREVNII